MKTYTFQFATEKGQVFENTLLISLEEAKELWNKNYDKAYKYLSEGIGVQMYIWKDMKDEVDYHSTLVKIDNDFITKDGLIYPPPVNQEALTKFI